MNCGSIHCDDENKIRERVAMAFFIKKTPNETDNLNVDKILEESFELAEKFITKASDIRHERFMEKDDLPW